MIFKAIAATLTVLLMLAGAIHNKAANPTHAAARSIEHRGLELGMTGPNVARGTLHKATLFSGVMDAAKQAGHKARSHVPEPKALLLLGLVLLVFGLRRGNAQDRDRPPQ